jgi:DNA-binding GntR family transcriptional regulator
MAALEGRALRLAFSGLTMADLQRVETLADSQRRARDIATALDINLELHLALYAPARIPLMLDLIRTCHSQSRRYGQVARQVLGPALPPDCPSHRDLIEVCRRGALEEAIELLDRHILRPVEALLPHLPAR